MPSPTLAFLDICKNCASILGQIYSLKFPLLGRFYLLKQLNEELCQTVRVNEILVEKKCRQKRQFPTPALQDKFPFQL